MKKLKQIIGVLLIIAAVAALIYWEADGRGRLVTKKVLVAAVDIEEGDIITRQMLGTVSAMPDTVIAGAFTPGDINRAEGKEASRHIAKNQQISEILLSDPNEAATDGYSPFLIKSDWIDSRSSSLRRGDMVAIYSRDGEYCLGEYEVLFVKDIGDKEIIDESQRDIRDRVSGSGIIDHLEILTNIEEYRKIVRFVDETGEKLLIVQRGAFK